MRNRGNASFGLDIYLTVLFCVLTVATIILQVTLGGRPNSTNLETVLFSILQFIFSLAFSWLLARMSLREEFLQSQKKFALSAYRRIIEISTANERLLERSRSQMYDTDLETYHEMDVVREISLGIHESIKSSIADWTDIIGNEIETVEKIQNLRERQVQTIKSDRESVTNEEIDERDIEELLVSLPESLRQAIRNARPSYFERTMISHESLANEEEANGYIEVTGFYEEGMGIDVFKYKLGDKLMVAVGDVGTRIGVLTVYNSQKQSVGIIMNNLSISESYADFADLLCAYLRTSSFIIQLLTFEDDEEASRHYFTAKVLKSTAKEDLG